MNEFPASSLAPQRSYTFFQKIMLWVLLHYETRQEIRDKYGLGQKRSWYRLNYLELGVLALIVMALFYPSAHAAYAAIDPLTLNTLPGALSTVISNAKQFLLLGTAAALGLTIIRGGMFFIAGLARSILAAAG